MVLFNPSWGDKEAHTFLKDISLKVNVITQLGLKLVYYDVAVQHINYYTIETPSERKRLKVKENKRKEVREKNKTKKKKNREKRRGSDRRIIWKIEKVVYI